MRDDRPDWAPRRPAEWVPYLFFGALVGLALVRLIGDLPRFLGGR